LVWLGFSTTTNCKSSLFVLMMELLLFASYRQGRPERQLSSPLLPSPACLPLLQSVD
jgi:hypothetical protein